MTTSHLRSDLARDEGRDNFAYLDTTGNVTWGIGHKDNSVKVGNHFTDIEIDIQFDNDVKKASLGIAKAWPHFLSLSDLRQDCLVNMAFNLGVHGLMAFRGFLGLMAQGKYEEAAEDLRLHTLWYHQVGNRSKRIAMQIETDQHQE